MTLARNKLLADIWEIAKILLVIGFIALSVAPGIAAYMVAPDFSQDN
jgi:hypothetical protein